MWSCFLEMITVYTVNTYLNVISATVNTVNISVLDLLWRWLFSGIMWTCIGFPFSAFTLLVGWWEGYPACKKWVLVYRWWPFGWSSAHLIAPVVITTSISLCCSKIQNGDILVLANPGPPGKWPLKWRGDVNLHLTTRILRELSDLDDANDLSNSKRSSLLL